MEKDREVLRRVAESSLDVERAVLDGEHACFSSDPAACRRVAERGERGYFRTPFAHDADRIMHCHAYARYMDKTQVFFQVRNDYLSLMTDQYFLKQYRAEFMTQEIVC